MNCLLCEKLIPINSTKYCSKQCVKRAWYIRNNLDKKSYFTNNPDFWKTETGIGFKWERYAAKLLGATHVEFNGSGADLERGNELIDVKVCKLYRRKFKRGKPVKKEQSGVWVFNRNKQKPINFFFCIGLVKDKPFKQLLIPGNIFPPKGIVVGQKSKYDIYQI